MTMARISIFAAITCSKESRRLCALRDNFVLRGSTSRITEISCSAGSIRTSSPTATSVAFSFPDFVLLMDLARYSIPLSSRTIKFAPSEVMTRALMKFATSVAAISFTEWRSG